MDQSTTMTGSSPSRRMESSYTRALTVLVCLLYSSNVLGFNSPSLFKQRAALDQAANRRFSLYSGREEEIAKLEEQLKKLRDEVDEVVAQEEPSEDAINANVPLEMVEGKDMLLSERELISGGIVDPAADEGGESGSPILSLVGAVLGLGLLIAFSQVPVGQEDLSRYSTSASSTVKTIDLGDLNPTQSGGSPY